MCARKYNIIYADPPWLYQFPGTRAEKLDDYPVMCTRDIANMPVSAIAEENSALIIWGIWPRLPDCLQVISAWGFEYKTVAFVWVKTTAGALVEQYSFLPVSSFAEFFGMGSYTRSNTEFCLLGLRGKMERASASVRQIVYEPIRRHSEKPPVVRDKIIELFGNLPRVELFARSGGHGWDLWGNEVPCSIELGAQNTMESGSTAYNSAMLQGLKPHAGGTGTSA